MQFGPPGPFCRFQHGFEPDQHFLALNQCWKVMLTMQSQNLDSKGYFYTQNQQLYRVALFSLPPCILQGSPYVLAYYNLSIKGWNHTFLHKLLWLCSNSAKQITLAYKTRHETNQRYTELALIVLTKNILSLRILLNFLFRFSKSYHNHLVFEHRYRFLKKNHTLLCNLL